MKDRRTVKDVCCALIEDNGKFLVARRNSQDSFGGLWEFPGGSLEPDESKEDCLKREIKEELGVDIEVLKFAHFFQDEIPSLKINIFLFICNIKSGTPQPLDCQEVLWASFEVLKKLKLAQADTKILNWLISKRNADR